MKAARGEEPGEGRCSAALNIKGGALARLGLSFFRDSRLGSARLGAGLPLSHVSLAPVAAIKKAWES